jgi:exodeoxyribonuclease VII large subunit
MKFKLKKPEISLVALSEGGEETMPARRILTVSEITRNIRFTLEDQFSGVWVEGEISNFKAHSSGHMYFSVKDEEAQMACVMFRRENVVLNFVPEEGMKILCFGRVSVYSQRGQYQLYVERMEPKGVGALQIRFQQLKEKLEKEGMFDASRKVEIPYLPKRVAIVTSIDGAALRDILNIMERRFTNAHILIYPVAVQGAQAAPMIAQAIDDLNAELASDVMILARGGGSLEDLWAFNEESVARAIFRSEIPVISAIGHETDFTIADFVADLRAPTPSAAAELVLPLRDELVARIEELKNRSLQSVFNQLRGMRENFESLSQRRVLKDPLAIFQIQFQKLDELMKHLGNAFQNRILGLREKAGSLIAKLDALGPLATLKRGFSVSLSMPEDKVVTSVKAVKVGNMIKTKLNDGSFTSRITEVQHGR